jgi:hypothetical protein
MDVMKKMKVALAERGERSDLIDEYDHSAED